MSKWLGHTAVGPKRLLALTVGGSAVAVVAIWVTLAVQGAGPFGGSADASAPPSVQQVGQVGGDVSLRDEHASDRETVAALQRDLPFDVSKTVASQVPPGLQLRYARSLPRQGGTTAQLELHCAAPEWHGGKSPGDAQYAGPLLLISVSAPGDESIANKNVDIPTGLPGVRCARSWTCHQTTSPSCWRRQHTPIR